MRASAFLALACLFASGCMVGVGDPPGQSSGPGDSSGGDTGGDDTGGGDEPAVTPTVTMDMSSTTFDLSLGTSAEAEVTVTSVDGYVGDVGVDVTGALDSWNVTVVPETLNLAAGESAIAVVTVEIPTDAEAAEAGQALEVVATPLEEARDLSLTTGASASVENVYYHDVPAGSGLNGDHQWPSVTLRLGATVEFGNADDVTHRIHSNHDDVGFPHQSGSLVVGDPETNYAVTINETGTFNEFYCHEHGTGTGVGSLTIIDPAAE